VFEEMLKWFNGSLHKICLMKCHNEYVVLWMQIILLYNNIFVIDICLIWCNTFYHINFHAKCLNKCLNGLKIYCIQTVLMKCPNQNVAWWLKTIFLHENIVVLIYAYFHANNLQSCIQRIWKVACKELKKLHAKKWESGMFYN